MRPHAGLGVEAGDAERHDGQGGQLGVLVEDAGQRVVEHVAVVDAGADDDLAPDLDAVVEQGAQPAQARGAPRVAQHAGPQLRIGGVDADVQRRQTFRDDPFEVGLGEAGQRGEVPVQEAQPVVVVLEVQAAAQPLRQLVDEAELAVVVARPHAVEHGARHLGTERLAGRLAHVELQLQAAAVDLQADVGFVGPQAPLDHVAGDAAVDPHAPRRRPGARRRRLASRA